MLDGINGQYAESDWHAELHGHLGQALGAFAGHVFEVRSTATNHSAQGDDGCVFTLLSNFLRNQWNFEGARGTDNRDVAFAHTVANQGIHGTAYQAFNYKAVEAANHQGIAAFGGDEGTFDGLQGHSTNLLKSRDAKSASLSDDLTANKGQKTPAFIRRARILQLPDRIRISH